MPGIPWCGERVTLITLPERCGMNALVAAAWVICQVPCTFSSITVRKPFGVIASAGLRNWPPALLTSTSRRPWRSTTPSNRRVDRVGVADVHAAPPPPCRPPRGSRCTVSSSGSARRPQPTTVAPSAASSTRSRPPEAGARPGDDADLARPAGRRGRSARRVPSAMRRGAYPRQAVARTRRGPGRARIPRYADPPMKVHAEPKPLDEPLPGGERGSDGHRRAAARRRGGVPARVLRAPRGPLRDAEDDGRLHLALQGLDVGPVPRLPDHPPEAPGRSWSTRASTPRWRRSRARTSGGSPPGSHGRASSPARTCRPSFASGGVEARRRSRSWS